MCAAQEASKEAKKTITLEPLDQGGITLHFDELVQAVKASTPDGSPWVSANAMQALRGRAMTAWAVWSSEKIQGFAITRPIRNEGRQTLLVYALWGHDLTLAQWQEAIDALCTTVKPLGFTRVMAITDSPRVLDIVRADGWRIRNLCEKEV